MILVSPLVISPVSLIVSVMLSLWLSLIWLLISLVPLLTVSLWIIVTLWIIVALILLTISLLIVVSLLRVLLIATLVLIVVSLIALVGISFSVVTLIGIGLLLLQVSLLLCSQHSIIGCRSGIVHFFIFLLKLGFSFEFSVTILKLHDEFIQNFVGEFFNVFKNILDSGEIEEVLIHLS